MAALRLPGPESFSFFTVKVLANTVPLTKRTAKVDEANMKITVLFTLLPFFG